MIPYGHQFIDDDDIAAVSAVLRGEWLTQGPAVDSFEDALAAKVGCRHAVVFSSGTAALHGAMYAAGVVEGEEVITSPLTFAATSNSVLYQRGIPVFADIDEKTGCLDPEAVRDRLSPKTKVIASVSYSGYPVDLEPFLDMARSVGALVVEDGCHSLGASRGRRMVGQDADMTAFSFHPVKHITTGEGGAVVTDDDDLAHRLRVFRSHGIIKDKDRMEFYEGPWSNEMIDLGYNYRLCDIQCALGLSQMSKLDRFIECRRAIAKRYDRVFGSLPGCIVPASDPGHGYHLYAFRVPAEIRAELFEHLRANDIWVQVHYPPVHLHPYYRKSFGYAPGDFPVAERFFSMEISLPIYVGLSEQDQDRVISLIADRLAL
ncbi:UDP-4-amino-4,6-dideoxy-N-acetyl-beta-L-altrosamine transaminase [Dethiosulfovibrio salsuginis]|uniref:UDP-4-amino-4,6-dideoxy-N-acetyl-beta-L-altrosamine transaminase n=1 Tax=Dethiosulfovibrio salsuginis TaxID=561720 RepID=A0A1X7IU73_9BACT|nr:UDP-4-amino-4,6-dideoxy-N-acetyl-beta-L-altrosamine transaminase [Dethiosulfovibrio salsuginis]SMG18442.1 UDP-4-amino-4,6-dideoxy-N-acetyl-beta-L-altrosamine transaminase [Dethiosulfovibrio salsuginis]